MIDLIWTWFKKAVPEPTDKNRAVQYGCHLEELLEMFDQVRDTSPELLNELSNESDYFKSHKNAKVLIIDNETLLDSLCDQIVTAVGVAYMHGFDIRGALQEVNRSNWSKFVNGDPVFDENWKIRKGENYSPPDLSKYV